MKFEFPVTKSFKGIRKEFTLMAASRVRVLLIARSFPAWSKVKFKDTARKQSRDKGCC